MSEQQTLTAAELEALNAEALLELDISELADVTAYVPKPSGLYQFQVLESGLEEVGAENKIAIDLKLKVLEVLELADESEADEVGDLPAEYGQMFFLDGGKGYGVRSFVTLFRELAVENGWTTANEISEGIGGAVFSCYLERRKYKVKDTGEIKVSNQLKVETVQHG